MIRTQSEHEFELTAIHAIKVMNPFGDIHVRSGAADQAKVVLFTQTENGSPAKSGLRPNIHGDALELSVWIEGESGPGDVMRIDAVITVPPQPRLLFETVSGTIEVKKLSNPFIEARSEAGNQILIASSQMRAHSVEGTILATIMQPGWKSEIRLVSDKGNVEVSLPLGPDLKLRARAAQGISSEFALDIERAGAISYAEFQAGDGSDAIYVESSGGKVDLYSQVFDPRVYGAPSITKKQTNRTDGNKN